ncbi:MAG: hypothetical protein LC105_10545 [Chitinophagales bacterium]|nr:hypothetical protein [Chitinophagales bacterium]MCZ2394287.1 hypothetical protein [Chitinophagales bacterium]
MLTGITHLHSTLAILVILALLLSIIYAFISKPINEKVRKIAKISMIILHIQFLVGLILYFISPLGFFALSRASMSNSESRFFFLEHPFVGLLAVITVTIGHAKLKRSDDSSASKAILLYYGIGLLLILSRVPWSSWSILN